MIPAILVAPIVQGVLGQVASMFAPEAPASAAPAPSSSFTPHLNKATLPFAPAPQAVGAPSGTMTSEDWSQMSPADLQSWLSGLTGRHVHATDISGRTISGVVEATQATGGAPALNVGGHLVSLSQINQITWSPDISHR